MTITRILGAATAACALIAAFPAPVLAASPQPAAAEQTAPRVIDRGRFTVEVQGQGPDVILIPGLSSSRDVWDQITPDLTRNYRVHRVQVAGFAGLPAGPNADGPVVQPLVAAITAYIREAGLERPAVIGHSMGGFTGLLLAQQHPDLIGRVMIVDAASYIAAISMPTATVEMVRPIAEQTRQALVAMSDEAFAAQQAPTAAFMMKSEKDRPAMIRWNLSTDRKVMAQAMYDIMTMDARPGLAAMTTPVTVLYAYDPSMSTPGREVTPATLDGLYGSLYQGLPGVKLVRVDGAYHFIMFDQPERFAQETRAFLAAKD